MAASWQVTGQQADQTTITSGGQVVTGHQVYFITGDGHRGSVFVPDDVYPNLEAVRQMLAAAAGQTDAVGNLSSSKGQ